VVDVLENITVARVDSIAVNGYAQYSIVLVPVVDNQALLVNSRYEVRVPAKLILVPPYFTTSEDCVTPEGNVNSVFDTTSKTPNGGETGAFESTIPMFVRILLLILASLGMI
jgi:hypothetical protein